MSSHSLKSRSQAFPLAKMQEFGNVFENPTVFEFDLSTIPSENYYPFFSGLPNVLYKKATKITFSTTAMKESQTIQNQRQKMRIQKSIVVQKPLYIAYLIKIICKVVPRSKYLHSLIFQSIHLPPKMWQELSNSLPNFIFLKNISFINVDMKDKNFQLLLSNVSPSKLVGLNFIDCMLTSAVFPSIEAFLQTLTKLHTNSTLKTLNFSKNEFQHDEMEYIKSIIPDHVMKGDAYPSILNLPSDVEFSSAFGFVSESSLQSSVVLQQNSLSNISKRSSDRIGQQRSSNQALDSDDEGELLSD